MYSTVTTDCRLYSIVACGARRRKVWEASTLLWTQICAAVGKHKGALEALSGPANQRSSIQHATLCEKIVAGVIDGAQRPHVSARANHLPSGAHSLPLARRMDIVTRARLQAQSQTQKKCTSHQDGGPQYIEQLRSHYRYPYILALFYSSSSLSSSPYRLADFTFPRLPVEAAAGAFVGL